MRIEVSFSHLVGRDSQLTQWFRRLLDAPATSKEYNKESYQDEEQQQTSYDITDYIDKESGKHHNYRPGRMFQGRVINHDLFTIYHNVFPFVIGHKMTRLMLLQYDPTYKIVGRISSQLCDVDVVLADNTLLVRMHQVDSC